MRLDRRVSEKFKLSRRKAREYVESGRADVEGVVCREPATEVSDETRITLDLNRPAVRDVRMRLSILHEDRDLIIVDKPAGLLTLATEARERETLVARVNLYLARRYRGRPFLGVVHRLDKETSGAIAFARNRKALTFLQDLFRRHDLDREYVAIVEGSPRQNSGTIDLPLVRDRGDRRRGVARGDDEGRPAITHYRVLELLSGAAFVSLTLETGRTHQIRIHLASIGHPVLGDRVYRPRSAPAPPLEVGRQMLHARRLALRHPSTNERVDVSAPLPKDFERALESLRRRAAPTSSSSGRR